MNIAEILKNKPEGFKFYSVQYGEVKFNRLLADNSIVFKRNQSNEEYWVNAEGKLSQEGEVLIFPSKDNRNWNTVSKFRNGDIITLKDKKPGYSFQNIAIFKQCILDRINQVEVYCQVNAAGEFMPDPMFVCEEQYWRKANTEEIVKFYEIMNSAGYCINNGEVVVKNRFDITTLKPFDEVLVRDADSINWNVSLFSYFDSSRSYPFYCINNNAFRQCIPYNNKTKHLVGTNIDCPKFYKTWNNE